ncbi:MULTISPECIES: sulfotransferase family 2 domain-containing protein [unclassified Cyanobium]|uniref:sulfotransferase family 2 domain-containing protein n=1 Tax=unclassified Cyanobium TaxID=2627006 RepID=UPI0020CC396D|nr:MULTISPECIES: sulfotransferase family 2 domain-containing protein [unclassified Cyanobium]MCP9835638.1 sulfotransferase family 2 domain-containing protein [Cyanobium sp. La Preciosa 7G6]MCP9938404.1 sulfotransferase family 2 domain-containing protein [Cyanobium sp. Aljojuca 7A6]
MTILTKDSNSILFLHVPKCGGSSIVDTFTANGYTSELEMRGKPAQDCLLASPQHQTCSALKSLVRFDNIKEIFMVVRNPYQRLVSEYNWIFREVSPEERPEYSQWVINSIAIVEQDPYYLDNHLRPMIDFLDVGHPARIFRLEGGLQAIIEFYLQPVESMLNITVAHNKKASLFKYKSDNPALDERALHLVNKFYRDDFLAFGYEPTTSDNMQSYGDTHCTQEESSNQLKVSMAKEWQSKSAVSLGRKLRMQSEFLRNILDDLDRHVCEKSIFSGSSLTNEHYLCDLLYEDILLKLSVARGDLEYSLRCRGDGSEIYHYSSSASLVSIYRDRIALHQLNPMEIGASQSC